MTLNNCHSEWNLNLTTVIKRLFGQKLEKRQSPCCSSCQVTIVPHHMPPPEIILPEVVMKDSQDIRMSLKKWRAEEKHNSGSAFSEEFFLPTTLIDSIVKDSQGYHQPADLPIQQKFQDIIFSLLLADKQQEEKGE